VLPGDLGDSEQGSLSNWNAVLVTCGLRIQLYLILITVYTAQQPAVCIFVEFLAAMVTHRAKDLVEHRQKNNILTSTGIVINIQAPTSHNICRTHPSRPICSPILISYVKQ